MSTFTTMTTNTAPAPSAASPSSADPTTVASAAASATPSAPPPSPAAPASPTPPPAPPKKTDGTAIISLDPWLEPFSWALKRRHADFHAALARFSAGGGLTGSVSKAHEFFGFNRGQRDGQPGVWFREWAPAARSLSLIGDFNGWNRGAHPLARADDGTWSIFLPDSEYAGKLTHGSRVKVHVVTNKGGMDRLPSFIRRAVQDDRTKAFDGQFWMPAEPYRWQHPRPVLNGSAAPRPKALRIYEAHPGMASEQEKVATWAEFAAHTLPRAHSLGYNAVQLMAVAEHPYYGSFGYHVSNFFAPSSRFGTPEDLKALIDKAHGLGMVVLMDIVHSHSVKNIHEGLNQFDGTEYQYFHAGPRGKHQAWDSLCFDYGKYEVLRFLLSNVRYWLEEYNFDGFRFDGVTSMMYYDHGLNRTFNGYADYFSEDGRRGVDRQAVTYLQLANTLVKAIRPDGVSVAEDVSGMPGLARPVEEGGLGFDYRLAMGLPDYWIKIIKERKDEDWHMGELWHVLMHRRSWQGEPHIAYSESHDQALVGDKTIAFRLMDSDMYWHMARDSKRMTVDRGCALHKMIRLISFAFGGEGWLTFMGNEFGHPDWIDFPRQGNGFSYRHARRQWSLADNDRLRFKGLNDFDRAMQQLDIRFGALSGWPIEQLFLHEDDKIIAGRRGPLIFAFNWHPTRSQTGLRLGVPERCDYRLVLNTDSAAFAGYGHVADGQNFPLQNHRAACHGQSVQIYLPARTAQVLAPASLLG
jgi:1,4-alpha-glucan branching enzyme